VKKEKPLYIRRKAGSARRRVNSRQPGQGNRFELKKRSFAMKTRTILVVCASLLLLAAQAIAAEGMSDERHSDLWLKAKLVTAYTLNQHLNPFKLDVDVKDGVAHLRGTVDSPVERDLAVEIAKGIDGITKVQEDIRIEPGSMAGERPEDEFFRTVEDASITARVKSKLLWNRNTNGLNINVSTDNGVVTLKGQVESDTHRDLAVQLAKNTTGVQRVRNELDVVPQPEKAEGKGVLETMEAKTSDAMVTAKVKSMLLFSKEAEGADIKVSTTSQVVTLEGTVTSEEQKEKILEMANDVIGVKEVRSKLSVEKG
jgi:osmotically-inducible protein OsmY